MLIFGAGGLAKEVINTLDLDKFNGQICLYDDVSENIDSYLAKNYKIARSLFDVENLNIKKCIIAIGGSKNREIASKKILSLGLYEKGYISSRSDIGNINNNIHETALILQNVSITINVRIGWGGVINKGVSISHDVKIGNYVEISPYSIILGGVLIGDFTQIGAGVTVLPGVIIGKNCIVGAGSVVTKNVPNNSVVVGVPAKIIKTNEN